MIPRYHKRVIVQKMTSSSTVPSEYISTLDVYSLCAICSGAAYVAIVSRFFIKKQKKNQFQDLKYGMNSFHLLLMMIGDLLQSIRQ